MKLISLNIETNLHNERVLPFLKKENPDVVCLQELIEEDFDFYKKELGLEGVYQPWDYCDTVTYPTLGGQKQGVGIFARNIVNSDSIFYHGSGERLTQLFSGYMSSDYVEENHALVWIDTKDTHGSIYRFVTTHLPVTIGGQTTEHQMNVANLLLDKTSLLGEHVLCGDMNAPRGKETFGLMEKKYKDNIPLSYETSIDQNLHRVKGIQFVVDCLFTTSKYKASNVILVDGLSDHMAIVAEISKI